MYNYNWIVNPETNRRVQLGGSNGRRILDNYLEHFYNYYGGAEDEDQYNTSENEEEEYPENFPQPLSVSKSSKGKSSKGKSSKGKQKTHNQRKVAKAVVGVAALATIQGVSADDSWRCPSSFHSCTGNSSTDGKKDAKHGKKDSNRYQNDSGYRTAHDKQETDEFKQSESKKSINDTIINSFF